MTNTSSLGFEIATGAQPRERHEGPSDHKIDYNIIRQYLAPDDSDSDITDFFDEELRELAEYQSEIKNIVDGLYELSFTIRSAAQRQSSGKALRFKAIDDETQQDLYACYAQYDRQHVEQVLTQFREHTDSTQRHSPPTFTPGRQNAVIKDRCFLLPSR
ncbi:hypothetical protein BDV19DRAFT_386234 [Aspergillus venezuelensis]